MSLLRRPTALKKALSFISREASPYSSSGFCSIRILGGVSIPRPPPSRPHVLSRGFSDMPATLKKKHPTSDWSDLSSKELMLRDGCDFEHWFIVADPPEGNPSRDEIIDSYIKTLANVVGSEEEARMKIYSVSTKHYYAFGCLISEELSKKLEPLPNVRWVLPDSYFDFQTKSYGGEPFINGQAVPYDPKYHEDWVRNNARCNEKRSRSNNDRNQNADRPRNFERRRDMPQNPNQRPPPNSTYQAPQGNTMTGPPDSQDRREMRQDAREMGPNAYQRPPPNSTYQAPLGNTMPGAPDSQGRGEIRQDAREMRPNAYQRPPLNSTYQAPPGNTISGAPDSQQGRREIWQEAREMRGNAYRRPPPNSTNQASQGNAMPGTLDSQGEVIEGHNLKSATGTFN